MALSVGFTGRNEVADIGLREWVRPADLRLRLQAELAEGINILSVQITDAHPSRQPTELAYLIPLLPGHSVTEARIEEFLSSPELTVKRTREDAAKEVDVRQFAKAIRFDGKSVQMLLRCTRAGTARPEEIMEAIGCREGTDYAKGQIERTHVDLSAHAD